MSVMSKDEEVSAKRIATHAGSSYAVESWIFDPACEESAISNADACSPRRMIDKSGIQGDLITAERDEEIASTCVLPSSPMSLAIGITKSMKGSLDTQLNGISPHSTLPSGTTVIVEVRGHIPHMRSESAAYMPLDSVGMRSSPCPPHERGHVSTLDRSTGDHAAIGLGPTSSDEMLIRLPALTGTALPGVHHDPIQGHDEGLAEDLENKWPCSSVLMPKVMSIL